MHNTLPIHCWKRWLPAVVLLVTLAQLATAAHWHWGEHSSAECGLFSQQNHTDDVINTASLSLPVTPSNIQVDVPLPAFLANYDNHHLSIRAPPAIS
ncbi:MAG: hypothetical protein ACRBBW_19385 [Cellvibrionaceae bacterium]